MFLIFPIFLSIKPLVFSLFPSHQLQTHAFFSYTFQNKALVTELLNQLEIFHLSSKFKTNKMSSSYRAIFSISHNFKETQFHNHNFVKVLVTEPIHPKSYLNVPSYRLNPSYRVTSSDTEPTSHFINQTPSYRLNPSYRVHTS